MHFFSYLMTKCICFAIVLFLVFIKVHMIDVYMQIKYNTDNIK